MDSCWIHGVMQCQSLLDLPVLRTGLDKTGVDLDVVIEAIGLAELLDQRVRPQGLSKRLIQAPRPAHELDQDLQRVVGGHASVLEHVVEQLQGIIYAALLLATVKQGVVENLVGWE